MPKRTTKTQASLTKREKAKRNMDSSNEDQHKNQKQLKDDSAVTSNIKWCDMDLQYIERVLLNESSCVMNRMYHDAIPAFNAGLFPEDIFELWLPRTSYKFSVPYPIYVANQQCKTLDACYKRPMNYLCFRSRLNIARSLYQNAKKKKKKTILESENIYPMCVYTMAERIEQNRLTDPDFHGAYDYYYSGGNLSLLPQASKILHVGGDNLQNLYCSQFGTANASSNFLHYMENSLVKLLKNDSEIFEIRSFDDICRNDDTAEYKQNCFLARQQSAISLFEYEIENNELKKLATFKGKHTPFISATYGVGTIAGGYPKDLLITTVKERIRQYDLNTESPTLVKQHEMSTKSMWNTIRPWSEHVYLYANEKQFSVIDLRTTPDEWLKDIKLCHRRGYECEQISAVKKSTYSNMFYIATSHRLRCFDIRYLPSPDNKDESCETDVYRWTHQCEYPPLMIDLLRVKNKKEYIALSSPVAGDISICELSRNRNQNMEKISDMNFIPKFLYKSNSLPYQPPTLQEAYNYARLKGKCLQPEANLQQRIRSCTTGLKFYNAPLPLLFFSNSNGDVYAHSIIKAEIDEEIFNNRISPDTSDIMDNYAEKIKQLSTPQLNYTEIVDLQIMRKLFRCPYLSKADNRDMTNSCNEDEPSLSVNDIRGKKLISITVDGKNP